MVVILLNHYFLECRGAFQTSCAQTPLCRCCCCTCCSYSCGLEETLPTCHVGGGGRGGGGCTREGRRVGWMMIGSRARGHHCPCRHHVPITRHLKKRMVCWTSSSPHPSYRRTIATLRRIPMVLLLLLLLVVQSRKGTVLSDIYSLPRQPLITPIADPFLLLLLLLLRIRGRRKPTFQPSSFSSSISHHATTTTPHTRARQGQIVIHRQPHTLLLAPPPTLPHSLLSSPPPPASPSKPSSLKKTSKNA